MGYLIGGVVGFLGGLVIGWLYAKQAVAAAKAEFQKIQKEL